MEIIRELYGVEAEIAKEYTSYINHARTTHNNRFGSMEYMMLRIEELSLRLFKRGIIRKDNNFYRLNS